MKSAVSLGMLEEFILDNNLTENDTLILHPHDYDTVAAEYFSENNLMIFRPVEIFGVKIIEDTSREVKKNHIYVMPLAAS